MHEAVIVIDMLEEFVHGRLGSERTLSVVAPIERLLIAARRSGKPVVYVGDAHLAGDPEMRVWGPHAMKGSAEAQIVKELQPHEGDYVLEKRTYSAFHDTGLDLLLRGLRVDTAVIVGIHTHICDRQTAADAFARGYEIIVPEECVNAFTDTDHQNGMADLRSLYGARTPSLQELTEEWMANAAIPT